MHRVKIAQQQIAWNPQYYHADRFLTPYQRKQKAERVAAQRQKEYEARVKELETAKKWAYVDIAVGGAGLVLTGVLYAMTLEGGGLTLAGAIASGAYSLDMVTGGFNALDAIAEGTWEEDKEYKFAKGLIIQTWGEDAGIVYDIGSIAVGGYSAYKNITKISGKDIKGILHAFDTGADSYSIGTTVIELKKKVEDESN